MNCRKVNNLLSAYIDGELTGSEQLAIREHIKHCACCEDEYESLIYTKRMVARLVIKEPSEDLESRIFARLSAEQMTPAPRRWFDLYRVWSLAHRPVASEWAFATVAGAVALFAVSVRMLPQSPTLPPDLNRAANVAHASVSPVSMAQPSAPQFAIQPAAISPHDYLVLHNTYNWDDAGVQPGNVTIQPVDQLTVKPVDMDRSQLLYGR